VLASNRDSQVMRIVLIDARSCRHGGRARRHACPPPPARASTSG
jgi:hypothetical protein